MKRRLNDDMLSDLLEKIRNTRRRLILLDFDGTLVDFKPDIALAIPSGELLNLLKKIAKVPGNKLVIITGRKEDDIDRMVGHLPIDIVAEHGAVIRENGMWRILLDGSPDWMKEVLPIMNEYCSMTPNSFVEEKHFSLAWHFRNADKQTGENNSKKLSNALKKYTSRNDLKILNGGKVVEILCSNINKGAATRYLLNKRSYDLILSMGDGKTDEDMFKALLNNNNSFTFKIGQGNSLAKYKLTNIEQVIELLESLLNEMVFKRIHKN